MSYRVPANNQHLKLQPGEAILWQGRPVQGFKFYPIDLAPTIICLIWFYTLIDKCILIAHPESMPISLRLIMIGLFLFFGGYLLIGRFLFSRSMRRATTYMLTNRRVLIHMRWRKRDYQHSYDLARIKSIMLDRLPNGQQSIIFDNTPAFTQYLFFGLSSGFTLFFEGVPNTEALYQQILELQATLRSNILVG